MDSSVITRFERLIGMFIAVQQKTKWNSGSHVSNRKEFSLCQATMKKEKSLTVIVVISLITITSYRLSNTSADIDLWGYMSFGKLFWEGNSFPYRDLFSYVSKEEIWIYHEWLTGVLLYKIYDLFGEAGLQILRYLVGFSTAGLVYAAARLRGAEKLSSSLGVFFASIAFGIGYAPVRAQIFTYFFFVLTVFILELARDKERFDYLSLLIPIQILWCNLHGGFVAGLGLTAIYGFGQILAGRPFLPFLYATVGSTISTLINPYGISYWFNIYGAISMGRPFIAEWWSVYTAIKMGYATYNHLFFVLYSMLAILALVWYRWKDFTDSLVLVTTAFLGFQSNRHEVFFFLSFGIYLPRVFMAYVNRLTLDPKFLNLVAGLNWKKSIAVTLSVILFPLYNISRAELLSISLPSKPTIQSAFYYPLGAVQYIRDRNLTGNVLTDFEWGEFVMWKLYPKCLVSMDARYESVYPKHVFDRYIEFYFASSDWRVFLDQYPHDMILIKRSANVYPILRQQKNWCEVYSDIGSALFVRCDSDG